MMRKRLLLIVSGFLLINVCTLWATDSASFADLGFSPDGRIYMFAQYGVRSGTLRSWADMFVVDVAQNNFVSGGRVSYTHDRPITAGQDGSGALHRIIAQNSALAERYNVPFTNQGQPLYIALTGDPAYEGITITFRDFARGTSYRANLTETIIGSGRNAQSSFHISLESVSSDGRTKTYTVGTPNLQRTSILSYRIKKVLIDPSGNSLIFVIEMKCHTESGHDVRYMIEALRF